MKPGIYQRADGTVYWLHVLQYPVLPTVPVAHVMDLKAIRSPALSASAPIAIKRCLPERRPMLAPKINPISPLPSGD